MGLTMTGCSCGGKQVAPAINLCQVSPLGSTWCLRPAMVDVAHLRLPPRRSKFLKCLQMSILGRKDSPPLSLGLVTLQLHGATTTFPCCSGGDGGPKVREKGATCLEVPRWFGCLTPCPRERLLTETPSENTVPAVSSLAVFPQGDSSFVVMTNFIVTPGQKQETCPEVKALASFSSLRFCNFGGCGGDVFLTLRGLVKA